MLFFLNACMIATLGRVTLSRGLTSGVVIRGAMPRGAFASATIGRAAASAFRPIYRGSFNTQKNVKVLSDKNKLLANIKIERNSIKILNREGRELIKSSKLGNKLIHRDFQGKIIGRAEYSQNGNKIYHYDAKGNSLGYDLIDGKKIKHYDYNGKYMGFSMIDNSGYVSTKSAIAGVGIATVIASYSDHPLFTNDDAKKSYDEYMDLRKKCSDRTIENYYYNCIKARRERINFHEY